VIILLAPPPMIFLALSTICVYFYPIDANTVLENRLELNEIKNVGFKKDSNSINLNEMIHELKRSEQKSVNGDAQMSEIEVNDGTIQMNEISFEITDAKNENINIDLHKVELKNVIKKRPSQTPLVQEEVENDNIENEETFSY
jgi:hypothetical protein